MAQPTVIVVTIATLAALGGLAYVHANRDNAVSDVEAAPSVAPPITPAEPPPTSAMIEPEEQPVEPAAPAIQQAATNDVASLIADTRSNDARTRAAAIEALANAPKAQAIPALKRVLESGDPQVDRQIALRSLHTLALNDGDSDGVIRDTIRYAIYHSEDDAVTQNAQALLEDIEAEFDDRAQRTER